MVQVNGTAQVGFVALVRRLLVIDWQLLRHPRMRLAALGIVLIPAIYALIYLTSVWNPAGRTGALPVLIVNADRGAEFLGQKVRLGDELVKRLLQRPAFGYQQIDDEAAARQAVRAGRAQFALLVSGDFSQRALAGIEPGAARIVIYTSEGNDYSGSNFAKRFAPELARQVNEFLNRERWALVLRTAAGTQLSLDELHTGFDRLMNGAHDIARGTTQLRQGSEELTRGLAAARDGAANLRRGSTQAAAAGTRLADGVNQLGSNLRSMTAKLPPDGELSALSGGAATLADGERRLRQALDELHSGAQQLKEGTARFKSEAGTALFVGERMAAGASQLEDGAGRLAAGIGEARAASDKLADGAARVDAGTRTLVDGLMPLGAGLRQMAAAVPADDDLANLTGGLSQLDSGVGALGGVLGTLHAGAQRLSGGLGKLDEGSVSLLVGLRALSAALPASAPFAVGSAGGLAGSVQPVIEIAAPVAANGAGFAPNFIAVALWVGATLCSFLWPLRRLADIETGSRRIAVVLGKLALPGLAACAQALVVLAMVKTLLPVPLPGGLRLVVTLLVAALTFLAILLALVRLLGEVGKAVALLLLVTQISAAGGTIPVALTTDFHRAIHPFLPFTWVIRALRAAMFGAYDGAWAPAIGVLAAAGIVAMLCAAWLGSWKRVPLEEYRPALEID